MARVPRKKVSEEKKLGPVPFPVLMDQGNPKLKVVLKFGKKATLVSSSPPPQPVNKLPPRNFVLNEPEKPEAGTFALFSDVKKPATTAKPVIKTEERQKPENNNHLKRKRIDDEEEYDFDAELKEKQKAIDQSNRLKITVNPSKKMKMNFSNFSTPTQPSKQSHNNNNNTNPQQLRQIIRKIMQQLIKIDQNKIFMDPVTDEMAPGYSTMITTPMCFKMMMEAESNNKYDNIQKFEFLSFLVSDFQQMCANCLTYNLPESPFYQDGVKMREEGLAVIQRILGYIPETNIKPTTIDNAQRQSLEMELSAQNEEKEKKEVKEEEVEESSPEEITEPEPKITRLIDHSKALKIGNNPAAPTQLIYFEPISFTINKQKMMNESRTKIPVLLTSPYPPQLNDVAPPTPENYQGSLEKFIEDFPDSAKRLARYYHDYKMCLKVIFRLDLLKVQQKTFPIFIDAERR